MIYLELFWTFLKIGLFTFGGGYAMLPLIQSEVERHGWMPAEEMVNFVAVSESTPGPFAVNISTLVGMTTGGILGALCATAGVVMPSFIIILLVSRFFAQYRQNRIVRGCMDGLRPTVIGLIAAAVVSVGTTVFFPSGFDLSVFTQPDIYVSLGIFTLMTVLVFKKLHPIIIICLSAALGIAAGYIGELI